MAKSLANELWLYMKIRRKYWLMPIIFFMALAGVAMILAKGSVLAPFIYTIF